MLFRSIVTVWSLPSFKALFAGNGALAATVLKFKVPMLDQLVIKAAPIVASPKPYEAVLKLDLLSAVGTAILLTAIISVVLLRMKPRDAVVTFGETLMELRRPILSIGLVLAFAFVRALAANAGGGLVAPGGGGFVPANTQSGIWLCQTSVCPTTCMPWASPNFTRASAGGKS